MKFTASVIGFLAVFTLLMAVGVITPELGAWLALTACAAHWAALVIIMLVKVVRKETGR
jgi:hypothetical protein